MLGMLFLAWFLSLFGFDEICVTAIKELFNYEITTATYYFVFAIVGLIFNEKQKS